MSEKAEAEAKKKGSKMPVIVVLVVVLMGGGFFGMKMKASGAAEKPKIELGEKMVEIEEMLVNLSDVSTFLRTRIAFQFAKGFDETKVKEVMPAIEDAVLGVLKAKSPRDIGTATAIPKLKRELANEVNLVLAMVMKDPHAKEPAKEPEGTDAAPKTKKAPAVKASKPLHPEWDSDTGPVLKVYFRSFAVQ